MPDTIIQSRKYVPNQSGWRVGLLTGEAEFNEVTITPPQPKDAEKCPTST